MISLFVGGVLGTDSEVVLSTVGMTAKLPTLTAFGLSDGAGGTWLNLRLFSSLCKASIDNSGEAFSSSFFGVVSSSMISGTKTKNLGNWLSTMLILHFEYS